MQTANSMKTIDESKQPLVSIVTASYNSSRFIQATIESVLAQTYTNWEMVIVDDRSSDRTPDIVAAMAARDDRIRLICLEQNQGPAVARNLAINSGTGRYVAFIDHDDLWLPEKLEKQIRFMQEEGRAISFTNYRRMSEDGSRCGEVITFPDSLDYAGLLKNPGIAGCLTVVIDREVVGDFEMEKGELEDHRLWIQLLKRGFSAYCLQQDLARYRLVGKSRSKDIFKLSKIWNLYYTQERLSFPIALRFFLCYAINALRRRQASPS